MGAIGIPVFAQMSGGLGSLFGLTGGYLVGFIPTAFIIGYFLEKTSFSIKNAVIANILGMFVALTFGTVWLKIIAETFHRTCCIYRRFCSFLIVGVSQKAVMAAWAGIAVRNRLKSTHLLYTRTAEAK